MSGNPISLFDFVDLCLLKLAKRRRTRLEGSGSREDFYESFFTDLDERVLSSGADPRKSVRLEAVRDGVRRWGHPGPLLDVGCGCGDNLAHLASLPGYLLHGLEYSQATLERAKRLLGESAEVRQGSAMALPFADSSMTTVTCIEVLEHVSDDHMALQEIFRVLTPGGVLLLTLPYRHWFPAYLDLMGHERHYHRTELAQILENCGYKIVEYLPNHPRWHRAADYAFSFCRLLGMVSAKMGLEGDPHLLRLPFARRSLLHQLHVLMKPLYRADSALNYPQRETSTWIVARKPTVP